MKAMVFSRSKNDFIYKETAIPQLDNLDVLVKVDACGLNPVDAKIRSWSCMVPGMDNWVPGLDVSGHIIEKGILVEGWNIGDQVLYHGDMFRPHGGFAEYALHDSRTLIRHPEISPVSAASTPCAGWTAWRALHDKLQAYHHHSILITGGAGGVGGYAIQIAKYFNIRTVITTCSSENFSYVKSLGATHVIDYRNENIVDRVREITNGHGVPVGLDAVGQDNDRIVADSLSYEGQMVELVDVVNPTTYKNSFMMGLSFHQLSLGSGHRNGPDGIQSLRNAGEKFSDLVSHGEIKPLRIQEISLDRVGAALNEMLKQKTIGKIVMSI